MFLYLPVEESLFSPVIGNYCSFGIRVVSINSDTVEDIEFISDVSVSKHLVFSLSLTFTLEQLDPVHLLNVIEDSL